MLSENLCLRHCRSVKIFNRSFSYRELLLDEDHLPPDLPGGQGGHPVIAPELLTADFLDQFGVPHLLLVGHDGCTVGSLADHSRARVWVLFSELHVLEHYDIRFCRFHQLHEALPESLAACFPDVPRAVPCQNRAGVVRVELRQFAVSWD